MKLWDIAKETIRENLLLFRDPERFRSVISTRIIAILVLGTALVAFVQLFQGKLSFDMGFVLSLFAIFISWLFFWSAEKISRTQINQLQTFLKEFREESSRGFDGLGQRMANVEKSIFIDSSTPPPPPPVTTTPDPNGKESEKAETLYAKALSGIMKEGPKQIIIALDSTNYPVKMDLYMIEYGFERKERMNRSSTMVAALAKELSELGMVEFDKDTGAMSLSPRGKSFAKWLQEDGQKADYFECPMLGISWGRPSDRYKHFSASTNKKNEG